MSPRRTRKKSQRSASDAANGPATVGAGADEVSGARDPGAAVTSLRPQARGDDAKRPRSDAAPASRAQSPRDTPSVEQPGSLFAIARNRGVQIAVFGLALAFFAVNAIVVARSDTPTPDEFVYVPAGVYHLETGDLTFDPTNPPLLKILMALPLVGMDIRVDTDPKRRDNSTGWGPWIFGTSFMELNRDRYLDAFVVARLVIIQISLALLLLVGFRAREMLSPAAALVVVVLFATMPPLIAHGSLATLDMGITALLFAAFFATARFASTREWGWAVMTGALFGFAFATKGTAALLAPLVPILVAAEWRDWSGPSIGRYVAGGVVMAASAWAAIMTSYGWSGFPLPAPLLEGIRFQLNASSAGEFPAFLFGSWSQKGWWYYYLVALGLKTPIATLVLAGFGAFSIARRRQRSDLWLVLPPLLLLYVLSFHYAKDYGVRYLLPAFPFLLLIAGRGADLLLGWGRRGTIALALLLFWQLASTTLSVPYHLAYFNELAGGPDRARHLLLDSNLDWGQDLGRLKQWLDARGASSVCLGYFGHVDPHVYNIDYTLAPATPTPGLCAISANFLAGYPYAITYAGDRIRGVRAGVWSWYDRLEPVARIGRSIYVFDVKPEDIARIGGASAKSAP